MGAPDYSLDEKTLGPRFDSPPWSLLYLKHQHDGPFWRERVRALSDITIPTFLIGGMQDGYRDNIPDMLMQSKAPIRAILGPWNHSFPNNADFGPRVEWRDQAVRWFDHWLKGRDTGVDHDPRLVVSCNIGGLRIRTWKKCRANGGARMFGLRPRRRIRHYFFRTITHWLIPRPAAGLIN